MPKYLTEVSYSAEGVKGLIKDGGSKRKQVVEAGVQKAGGKLEAFYFAFGSNDAFVIVDLPNNVSAAALNLAVTASGAARCRTVVLLTPQEIDEASKKDLAYTPPGH